MSTGIARFTGITSHAGALVTAIIVLTGAAILRSGAAAADSNQDDQFLALLDQEGIPALRGVPSLIYTAHKVCRELDAGMPADGLVDTMVNDAYNIDPPERLYAPGRLARTEARFITAAVEAYCPHDQSKIASILTNSPAGWNEPTQRVTPYTRTPAEGGALVAGRSGGDRSDFDSHDTMFVSLIRAVPAGEITKPNPPQIPAPPAAHLLTPPRSIAATPRPKQPPPPPQQPPPQQLPPPPQQPPPPDVAPQPGGTAGGGGNGGGGNGGTDGGSAGGSGGGRPAEPAPEPPMPPGFVTLAP